MEQLDLTPGVVPSPSSGSSSGCARPGPVNPCASSSGMRAPRQDIPAYLHAVRVTMSRPGKSQPPASPCCSSLPGTQNATPP